MKKPNTKSGIFLALAILVLAAIGAWFFWDRLPSPAGPAGPLKALFRKMKHRGSSPRCHRK